MPRIEDRDEETDCHTGQQAETSLLDLARGWSKAGAVSDQMRRDLGNQLRKQGVAGDLADGMARHVASLLSVLSLREQANPRVDARPSRPSGPDADSHNVIDWNSWLAASLRDAKKPGETHAPLAGERTSASISDCLMTMSSLILSPAETARRAALRAGAAGRGDDAAVTALRREGVL